MTPEEFLQHVAHATEREDLEEFERLGHYFEQGGAQGHPFEPDIHLHGQNPDDPQEANVAASAANAWARGYRLSQFRKRMRAGYTGPVLVSEGDSWFQYPWLLRDTIDNLMEPFAINSLGAAGDTLSNMLAMAEYREAIAEHSADVFLFSASGNDVLGGGDLATLLHRYQRGMELGDILRHDKVEATLARIEQGYMTVIREALAVRGSLRVFFHGYDRAVPRRNGKWLGKPMGELGIPSGMQALIAGHLIDLLNQRLHRVANRFPGRAHHVDCRGRVGTSVGSWYDELHPRNPGYARVAALFEAQIRQSEEIAPPRPVPPMPFELDNGEPVTALDRALERMEAPEEAIIDNLDSAIIGAPRGTHLTAADLQILDDYQELLREANLPDKDRRLRARRHMVPEDDERAFERILGRSNLFPVNFLSRGAAKAQAVAKIQLFVRGGIPVGSGSGFLVGPGLMLTNNHVLSSRQAASRAKAIFNYQDDDSFQPMPTQTFDITGDVFFTSDRHALDFTFVSVRMDNDRGETLDPFGSFTLIEESGKAVKGEPVSIVQHPRGDRKSIALRDSTIVGVKGDFIYYSTDTEPGSSGAPVLNDQWLPVALHHRSVPHPDKPGVWIANRGIRISQIFRALREAAAAGDQDALEVLRLLGADEGDGAAVPSTRPLRPREDMFIPTLDSSLPVDGTVGVSEAAFAVDRWDGVAGYDPDFLSETIALPLPEGRRNVREVNGRPDLPYKHFSVVMHEGRKLAMLTACNTDGTRLKRLRRSGSWRLDPRLPQAAQIDNEAYRHNDYDRGHLVRRVAPMWGSEDDARFAMADTFHYTVCAPQHARLNQGIWLELEDYILDWAEENAAKVSIFTGPLFRADDPVYRGLVQVPADYWKVAVAETPAGLRAVGYLHTQKNLIPTVDEAFGDYRTHRVPIHVLAELSGLDLSAVQGFDVAGGGFEAMAAPREVRGPEDIGL
ncbi:DNA/RNA non-specific endonuclease [Aestuariicoccus sp. MJ-SS9]|uniref:DNA/RNA non-specific endonuclease n=1 Tax=Aestuariicoccus sp. MJ-SS9 TaxID=3079855 RepID=UPI002912D7F1|nr:DNA/RNA non-specific endonuclease [Aestuariicoccus sp. MJ-SS9]MDU8909686.1 DNA/RNA non-specific endonuclease [Aestuariicoccus sp. MJ-SS9]